MLKINEDKGPKEQRKLFSKEIQPKIGNTQAKNRNKYEIYKLLFFIILMLFFVMKVKISLKYKRPLIKDIIFSFDYYNRIKSAKILDLNLERNYYGINGYIYQNIIFNPLNILISSQMKWKNNLFDKLSNIDKDDNNLKIYKKTKLISSLRIIFYKMILDKDIPCLCFDIRNYHLSREEKRKEEKRREERKL